jgi:hypothetical protein
MREKERSSLFGRKVAQEAWILFDREPRGFGRRDEGESSKRA